MLHPSTCVKWIKQQFLFPLTLSCEQHIRKCIRKGAAQVTQLKLLYLVHLVWHISQKKRYRIFFHMNILHVNSGNCFFFFPVGSLNRVKLKVVSLFCWQTGCSGILLTCSLWPLRAWAFLLTPTEIEHPSNICGAHLHSAWHTELPLTAISQALYSPVSTVLVKIAAKISPGIGTHASGESKKANKYIRYGSFVVYTHTHTLTRAWSTHSLASHRAD